MVCNRCISAVKDIFNTHKIKILSVDLGLVETKSPISDLDLELIESDLESLGFSFIKTNAIQLIEKIKKIIILKIGGLDISEDFLLSSFLSTNLHKDYSMLSKTFSQNQSITLERYFILQKIEKVKELLLYNEFNLTEISGKLGYKSVQHLSSQFRTATGFAPSEFKKLKGSNRKALDHIN